METKILAVESGDHLSIVQYVCSNIDSFEYISIGTAIREKLIEINEKSDAGSVNNILVTNNSGKYVFMMDGDILTGAKQNRIINTSILIAPQSKTEIKVSCVEQGRWRKESESFDLPNYSAPTSLRMKKNKDVMENLKNGKEHYANQSKIWNEVDATLKRMYVKSETSSLFDVVRERGEEMDLTTKAYERNDNANGIAIYHESRLIGLDLFNSSSVYKEYFYKVIGGAAWEVLNKKQKVNEINESELKYKTLEAIDKIEVCEKMKFNGVGVGYEERFENDDFNGFQLMFENKVIHLTAMNKK